MDFNVSILSDPKTFTALQAEWLELLSRSVTNYVFQSPQFQAAWWQALGEGELCIIAIRSKDTDQLAGLAPLYLHTNQDGQKELCFVGCVNVSDYLDILVDKDQQQAVYDCLAGFLTTAFTEWDRLFLCSLPENSPTRHWLQHSFSNTSEQQQDVSPHILLPNSWDEYLTSLNRKQRHELKRKFRRVQETEHKLEVVTTEAEAQRVLPDFITLHRASSSEKKDFWDDNHLKFFSAFIPAAAAAGWLKLYFLNIESTRVAAMLIFDYNNQFLLYNSGFDPSQFKHLSTGTVLTGYTIQEAVEQKKTVYDFLRGDEEYKFRFGAVAKPVFDVTVIRD